MLRVVSAGFRTADHNSCERIWKTVYADTQPKWFSTKEILMLSYYVFEIDYGYCGNYNFAIWATELRIVLLLLNLMDVMYEWT